MAKLNRNDAFSSILGSAKVGQRSGERQLPLDEIRLNPEQPRKFFDEGALAALTASVREKGVLQPVLVRERGDAYELVAGERRYRAAQRAGLRLSRSSSVTFQMKRAWKSPWSRTYSART